VVSNCGCARAHRWCGVGVCPGLVYSSAAVPIWAESHSLPDVIRSAIGCLRSACPGDRRPRFRAAPHGRCRVAVQLVVSYSVRGAYIPGANVAAVPTGVGAWNY